MIRQIFPYLALPIALTVFAPKPACAGEVSREAAVRKALAFCRAFGLKVEAPSSVSATAGLNRLGTGPRWSLEMDTATVEVARDSGEVVFFMAKYPAGPRVLADQRGSVPLQAALEVARTALRASGAGRNLIYRQAARQQTAWMLQWSRTAQGIPYADEGLIILVDAESGTLRTLSRNFRTPALPRLTQRISREQAVAAAVGSARRAGVAVEGPTSVERWIVQPGNGGVASALRGVVPRPAWVCRFGPDDNGVVYSVSVDLESGKIIAEERAGHRGSLRSKPPSAEQR